jgi:hypothetical protein
VVKRTQASSPTTSLVVLVLPYFFTAFESLVLVLHLLLLLLLPIA